jgi:rhodanese-related sulfurtransferase
VPSRVTDIPAADAASARAHFGSAFHFETDCWDVHACLPPADFVLLDVRSAEAYASGHVPGAINIPHARLIASRMAAFPAGSVFVVYCAGPHCNAAQRAALRLAQLNLPVKIMIGGMTGWCDEGFDIDRVAPCETAMAS